MSDDFYEQLANSPLHEWIEFFIVLGFDLIGIPLGVNWMVNGWYVFDWGLIGLVFALNGALTIIGLIRIFNDPEILDEE